MTEVQYYDDPALMAQAEHDAKRFISLFPFLTAWTVLTRVLASMYRKPLVATPPERRGDEAVSLERLERCRSLYHSMRQAAQAFKAEVSPPRRALALILEGDDLDRIRQTYSAFEAILSTPARSAPRSYASLLLLQKVDTLADYLLLVLGHSPDLNGGGDRSARRMFVDQALVATGWHFPEEEVDAACVAAMRSTYGRKPSQCGLRLTRAESAEAKAWREQHRTA